MPRYTHVILQPKRAQDDGEIAESIYILKEKCLYLKTRSRIIQKKTEELESRAVASNLNTKKKLYCDKGAIKWSQILATLTLSSEQLRLEKYSHCTKNKTDAMTFTDKSEEGSLLTEEFASNRIKEIKNEISKKRQTTENNKEKEQLLRKKIMLAKKRNNALLIRLGRQQKHAECLYLHTKANLDSLDDVLLRKSAVLKQHE